MSGLRISMNLPAGKRKPIPVPIGKKKVFVHNLDMSDGQVELTIPNVSGGYCQIEIIPYTAAEPLVTEDVDMFGYALCCFNNGLKSTNVDIQIMDIVPTSFL